MAWPTQRWAVLGGLGIFEPVTVVAMQKTVDSLRGWIDKWMHCHRNRAAVKDLVDRLMGRNPEHRFMFIQNRAGELDPEMIDA